MVLKCATFYTKIQTEQIVLYTTDYNLIILSLLLVLCVNFI